MNKLPSAKSVQMCIAPLGYGVRDTLYRLADDRTIWLTSPVMIAGFNQMIGDGRCALLSAHSVHKRDPSEFDRVIVDGTFLQGEKLPKKLDAFCAERDVIVVYTPAELDHQTQKETKP